MKKILITCQGINEQDNYLKADIKEAGGLPYDKIVFIDSEKHLARKSPFGIWDKFGDWILGIYQGKYKIIAKEILEQLDSLQGEGVQIDLLGHSFGSIPILYSFLKSSVHINKCYLIGSPLTARAFFVRKAAKRVFENLIKGKVQGLVFCYNNKDHISCKPWKFAEENRAIGNGHNSVNYLKELKFH